MDAGIRISKAAALIGDSSRAAMLWSLLGGESRPASELAMLANVSPQTASNHLRLLLDAGFLKVTAAGRNKFYRLAEPSVAAAVESLAVVVHAKRMDGAAQHSAPELVFARTCYDHLAGELGVTLLLRLCEKDYLRENADAYSVTSSGEKFLTGIGIDLESARGKRRRFAYACLDWSHRVPHLGGSLGAALLDWMFLTKILARRKMSRAIRLTDMGQEQLQQLFAIRLTHSGTVIR